MSSTNTSAMSTMNTAAHKKTAKKSTTTAATPAPVAAPVVPAPAAPVAEKKAKTSPAPTVTPTAASTAAPTATVETSNDSSEKTLNDEIKVLQDQLTSIREAANAALSALKRVAKRAASDVKEASKKKRRARSEPVEGEVRKPSNFEIPVPISDELSTFLGGGKNNKMSRAQVTSAITKYINEHNLRQKHAITPDVALRKLLGVGEEVSLTLFNIQTYLSRHYPKVAKPTTTA